MEYNVKSELSRIIDNKPNFYDLLNQTSKPSRFLIQELYSTPNALKNRLDNYNRNLDPT